MKLGIIALATLFGALVVGCSNTPRSDENAQQMSPQVDVADGTLEGTRKNDMLVFKGIRYAQPPVGENRWRAPQPLESWQGIKDAKAFGNDCMQKPFPGDAAPLGETPAEDCLFLNVWAPDDSNGSTPVMVWIHGGGLVNGGSSPPTYSGHEFAQNGVIFVSFNYRLGRFGFFAHPALTAADEGPLGNYGLLDQIAALEWIKKNIAAFGGDPQNITLVGESAGGRSVNALMQTPLADGLFQRAVVMSGGGRSLMLARELDKTQNGQPSAEQIGVNFASQQGINGSDEQALSELRALSAEEVLDGYNLASMFSPQTGPPTFSGVIVDGEVVRGQTESTLKAGDFARIPVMVGTTSQDLGMVPYANKQALFDSFGDAKEAAIEAYDPNGTRSFEEVAVSVGQDRGMQEPARFIAQRVTEEGEPAYIYRFGYVATSRKNGRGAAHASEIPFFFNTADIKYPNATEQDLAAAKRAFSYLLSFVKDGNPNSPALPEWSPYNDNDKNIMLFTQDGASEQVTDPWAARLDAVQQAIESQ